MVTGSAVTTTAHVLSSSSINSICSPSKLLKAEIVLNTNGNSSSSLNSRVAQQVLQLTGKTATLEEVVDPGILTAAGATGAATRLLSPDSPQAREPDSSTGQFGLSSSLGVHACS